MPPDPNDLARVFTTLMIQIYVSNMRLNKSSQTQSTTRGAIRTVAAEMFAEHGIDGVTTRALAEKAGVNMAAVNYHFGNKENLTLDVFREVARETVKRRLDNMARITERAQSEGRRPRLVELVDAFVDAYVNEDSPQTGILLAHLVLQHRVRPTKWTKQIVSEELDDFALKFMDALSLAAPHLSEEQIHWRYHLMVGAVIMSLSDQTSGGRMARLSNGRVNPGERAVFKKQLVAFLVDAFGQPADIA